MFKQIVSAIVPSFCLLFLAQVCSAEVAPHEFESWKSCKIGTVVRMEERDSSNPERIRFQISTLIKLTSTEASVEEVRVEISKDGRKEDKPSIRRIIPDVPKTPNTLKEAISGGKPATAASPADGVTEGDEEMTVAGQKVHAHWRKEKPYPDTTKTVWTSEEVPGGFVMIQDVTKSSDSTRERTWKVVEIKGGD